MEEENLEEIMLRMIMKFSKERERRDMAQQAVESVVKKVGRFNGNEVYNAEMTAREVDEAMSLTYFRRVAAVLIHEEVRELQGAHESWVSFEEALLEAYGYEKPEGQGQRDRASSIDG